MIKVTEKKDCRLYSFAQLPKRVKREFNKYVTKEQENKPRFFSFRNMWYDVSEFGQVQTWHTRIPNEWHGYLSIAGTRGIVFQYTDSSHENVLAAWYYYE